MRNATYPDGLADAQASAQHQEHATGARRVFLMLQGLASPLHQRLGETLRATGADVHKIHLCGGELVFWSRRSGEAVLYRGRREDWPAHVDAAMGRLGVTDLVLFGDCRPYHVVAMNAARARGITLHLFEEGYVRPNWITLEHHGVNANSDMPRDPDALRAEAARLGPDPEEVAVPDKFSLRAVWDVAWNSNIMASWPIFPHYRRHTVIHPLVEYAGWLRHFVTSRFEARRDAASLATLRAGGAPYFLLPLQLDGDFQIRVHSDFASMVEATETVFASFARAAPKQARLVVKRHPFDVEFLGRRRRIRAMAARHGITDRVVFLDGGDLLPLVAGCGGTLVVNSTSALLALAHGRPLKVLGRATYDIPGLAFQGDLDRFWSEAAPPDPELWRAYRRVLIARTQVNGGFFSEPGIALAVQACVPRILAARQPSAGRALEP